jgi:hypothetical protein
MFLTENTNFRAGYFPLNPYFFFVPLLNISCLLQIVSPWFLPYIFGTSISFLIRTPFPLIQISFHFILYMLFNFVRFLSVALFKHNYVATDA